MIRAATGSSRAVVSPGVRIAAAILAAALLGLLATSCQRSSGRPTEPGPIISSSVLATSALPGSVAARSAPSSMRQLPAPLYGVTLDDVSELPSVVTALAALAHTPTARVVFDPERDAAYYAPAIERIQPVSYIMGTLLDSSAMARVSVPAYAQRTTDFLRAFGDQVDLWEIGNEINGEWLCPSKACTDAETADVVEKISQAYDIVHDAGKRTALTLYYNGLDASGSCADSSENQMLPWAQRNVPERMKRGLDYVFISYYEQDCPGVSKDWHAVFSQLRAIFPNSMVGFGENGTTQSSDPAALKRQYMDEYYSLSVDVPGYVHGHFWWYFREDCVPSTAPLWAYLNTNFIRMPVQGAP